MFDRSFTYYNEFDKLFQDFIDNSDGLYRRILDTHPNEADTPYHREVANIKRFLECYTSRKSHKDRCLGGDAQKLANDYNLDIDTEAIRLLWDPKLGLRKGASWLCQTPEVIRYRCFIQEKILHRALIQEEQAVPEDNRMRLWRDRQVRRLLVEMGPGSAEAVIHTPFNVELSDGCSVGCWFCGVNAGSKGDDYLYTADNAAYWREFLATIKDIIGIAAVTGTCYYGTEPFDNPHYEDFCKDYAEILGHFPQTTTAVSTRDVERTRKLLILSRELGAFVNRFSVLSIPMFEKIMKTFSPLELLFVELLMQNIESTTPFALVGRAVENQHVLDKNKKKVNSSFNEGSSIACASGFRFNMVNKTIKLVTPKPSNDVYSEGELVYETASFTDIDSLRSQMTRMIDTHLPARLLPRDPVAFSPFADISLTDGTVQVVTGNQTQIITSPIFNKCYEFVAEGNMSGFEIAQKVSEEGEYTMEEVLNALNEFFDSGLLDESPNFFHAKKFRSRSN